MPKITQELCGRVRSGVYTCLGSKTYFNKKTGLFYMAYVQPYRYATWTAHRHSGISFPEAFLSLLSTDTWENRISKEPTEQTGPYKRCISFDFHSSSCVKTVLGSICLLKKNTEAQSVCILDAS